MTSGDYVCLNCGSVFSDPKRFVERHGLENPPYEEFEGCPEYGGGYVPAFTCDCCGEVITDEYMETDDGKRYCFNCYHIKSLGE